MAYARLGKWTWRFLCFSDTRLASCCCRVKGACQQQQQIECDLRLELERAMADTPPADCAAGGGSFAGCRGWMLRQQGPAWHVLHSKAHPDLAWGALASFPRSWCNALADGDFAHSFDGVPALCFIALQSRELTLTLVRRFRMARVFFGRRSRGRKAFFL